MIKDLKNEMNNYIHDLENVITDKEELMYVKSKTAHLFEVVVDEIEKAFKYKEDEIREIEQRQQETIDRMDEMDGMLKIITRDIYEDEEDFAIICPYCNNEFDADVDETNKEVVCPECENVIELDWGNDEDEQECNGNCSGCHGCSEENDEK
ncbi:MAG: hypothetical protein HFJ17_02600 [Clostridia bacterium]|nr:hypothetical protein [Clostridia bacterium]